MSTARERLAAFRRLRILRRTYPKHYGLRMLWALARETD